MENIQKSQLAFIISCIFTLFCAVLPSFSSIIALLGLAIWCFYRKKNLTAAIVFGFCWFFLHAHWTLSWSLPKALIKQPVIVIGVVSDIPSANGKDIRFNLQLDSINGRPLKFWQKAKLRLTWHNAKHELSAGNTLKLKVKLKPPHGLANDGGFNYQKWLLLQNIRATGYISGKNNVEVLNAGEGGRQHIYGKIADVTDELPYQGLLLALTVGEKQKINSEQWTIIRAGGISHLLAISGLHIGIVFLIGGLLAKWLLNVICLFAKAEVNSPKIAMYAGLMCAVGYAWLAGFAIPTVRALLMLSLLVVFLSLHKNINAKTVIINTLFLILLVNPLAVLEAGLWLSVSAVFIIIAVFWWLPVVTRNKYGRHASAAFKMQLALFVLMLPLTMVLFNGFSAASLVVNLLAVPWVSFTTVPLALLGCAFELTGLPSSYLFTLADKTLELLFILLHQMDVTSAWLTPKSLPSHAWVFVIIFFLSWCLPLALKTRAVSLVLLLPAILSLLTGQQSFKVHVLDVGQGLSVVVEKDQKSLVYDLGPTYRTGFNTAESVVLPFLTFHGYDEVDKLILSHSDSDHAGNWQKFIEEVTAKEIIAPFKMGVPSSLCTKGLSSWQGLKIEILWPRDKHAIPKNSNDSSCVVRISNQHHSILLPGDISKRVEKHLVAIYGKQLRSTILISPHHGSNSSSTQAFVDAVSPQYVIHSTGFLNRYKFPRKQVVERYNAINALQLNTAESGQLSFEFSSLNPQLEAARENQLRHWYYNQ